MRRVTIPLLVGALVVVGRTVTLGRPLVVAQAASPAASSTAVPEPLAAWAAAWAAADTEAILATYTDYVFFEAVPLGVVTQGKDPLVTHIAGLKAAFPDASLVVTDAFVAGDWAAAEWIMTGTYAAQVPGLPPGTGQRVTMRGSSMLELDGDTIRAERAYWDAYAFLVAVGVLPIPEATGTPTP